MNLDFLGLVAILGLPFLLGSGLLRVLGIRFASDRLAFLGWAWLAGAFGTALVLFAWLCTGPDPSSPWLPSGVIAVVGLVGLVAGRRVRPCPGEIAPVPAPAWERGILVAVVAAALVLTVERIMQAWLIPVVGGDEGNLWGLKAKILFASGGFNAGFRELLAPPAFNLPHRDYPLLCPLLHVWVFSHAGAITHVANRLPFQLLALAQVAILAGSLRRTLRPSLAALLLLVVTELPMTLLATRQADGDLLVATSAAVALDAWLRWERTRQTAWLRLAALALAAMVWSKNEGLHYLASIAAAGLVVLLVRWRERPGFRRLTPALWLVPPVLMLAVHWGFNTVMGFESVLTRHGDNLLVLAFRQLFENAPQVLDYYARHVAFDGNHSGLVLPCFLALVLAFPLAVWRSSLLFPAIAILVAFAGLIGVLIATPPGVDVGWLLTTSAQRVAFQLVPVTVIWIGAAGGTLSPALAAATARRSQPGLVGEATG